MIGQILGHYQVVAKIGAGGMGEVYRAYDQRLKRDVALKILPVDSPGSAAGEGDLIREAQAASALNDPHICTIYEVGEADGRTFIAMELVEGQPLSSAIPPEGLPAALVVRYGAQIAAALAHAHDRGTIHRDVKSTNIVITPSGQVKVLDFGLARRLRGGEIEEATQSRESRGGAAAIAGTLPYMAPEILRGEQADACSDIWALGVVLHEMAAGQRPYRGQTGYELSSAILREPPAPLPSSVPGGLRVVIERCLEKEPGHRYRRAGEVQAALEAAKPDASTSATISAGAVVTGQHPPSRARRPIAWTAGSLIAVVFAVLVALNMDGLRHRLLWPKPVGRIQSLAVLPLANLSRDPEQDYFADGMTEELTTALSKISSLRVISHTSVIQYKGTSKTTPQIARELNVDAILEGSVQASGDRVKITAQLIEAAPDRHLWAESYNRDLRDILNLQDEVARAVARGIEVSLTPQDRARLAGAHSVNPEAFQLYLRGRQSFEKWTADATLKARGYFKAAIEKDPGYALAYAGLADTYVFGGVELDPKIAIPLARSAALRALELDDRLSDAHAALAQVKSYGDWDFFAAESEFKRAIELNPGDTLAHHMYSHFLLDMGRNDEALSHGELYVQLDPFSDSSHGHIAYCYLAMRQFDKAITNGLKALEIDPDDPTFLASLGDAYRYTGRPLDALAAYEKSMRLTGSTPDAIRVLRQSFSASGWKGYWQKTLDLDLARSTKEYVSSLEFAGVYCLLGDKEQAFRHLEKAYSTHESLIVTLKEFPDFEILHSDPRYADLLRRIGLPPDAASN